MLLIDTHSDRAITMVGYGLEPLIQEAHLQSCLQAAYQPLQRRRFAQAIESFVRELDRQLVALCRLVPKQFGLVPEAQWLNASAAGEDALGTAENLYCKSHADAPPLFIPEPHERRRFIAASCGVFVADREL